MLKVEIPHRDLNAYRHYFDEAVRTKCMPDLLATRVFPNAKEITESFAAHNACHKRPLRLAGLSYQDPEVTAVCVGDGNTPRTATTLAFRTAWSCYSVDPRLKQDTCESAGTWLVKTTADGPFKPIERLIAVRKRIQDWSLVSSGTVVLVAVHSHADLQEARAVIWAPRVHVIAIPCCKLQELGDRKPDLVYEDYGIWSPQNKVKIWVDA